LIMRVFIPKARNPLGLYIMLGFLFGAVAIVLGLIEAETANDDYVWFFSWIPPVQMNVMDHVRNTFFRNSPAGLGQPDFGRLLAVSMVTPLVYFVLLLFCAIRNFAPIREVEQDAEGYTGNNPS